MGRVSGAALEGSTTERLATEVDDMLLLTDNATAIIKEIGDQPDLPNGSGLRISVADPEASAMRVDAAPGPAPEDEVIERDGSRVFLEPAAAALLDDKVLDARLDAGGSVEFLIAAQS